MDADETQAASACKKLHELPPVFTDWQQTAWCPDCDYYHCGICGNPARRDGGTACPFDGKELPLREVPVETPAGRPGLPIDMAPGPGTRTASGFEGLAQAIKHGIRHRTGGRVQALAIERTDREWVVRGTATCYYVKQLALQGALDALRSAKDTEVGLNFQVAVYPP